MDAELVYLETNQMNERANQRKNYDQTSLIYTILAEHNCFINNHDDDGDDYDSIEEFEFEISFTAPLFKFRYRRTLKNYGQIKWNGMKQRDETRFENIVLASEHKEREE